MYNRIDEHIDTKNKTDQTNYTGAPFAGILA